MGTETTDTVKMELKGPVNLETLKTFFKITPDHLKNAAEYEKFQERMRKTEAEPHLEKQWLPGEPDPDLKWKIETVFTEKMPEPGPNAIPITIVPREEWGALPRPKEEEHFRGKIPFVHQEYSSDTPQCFSFEECAKTVRRIQKRDIEQGYPDIRYNFLVGDDWNVYEGRGWYVTPEKTSELPRYHAKYYEIVFIGDMRRPNHPTTLQTKMVWSIIKKGIEELKIIDSPSFTFIMKHLDFYHNIKQAA